MSTILKRINKYLTELDTLGYLEGQEEDRILKTRARTRKYRKGLRQRDDSDVVKTKHFATLKRYRDKNKETHNLNMEYGPKENSIILKKEKSDFDIAKELGRTIQAIQIQRSKLNKFLSPEQIAELKK